jgi:hypothetical protein
MATRHLDSEYKEQENERNAKAMATRRLDSEYREQENGMLKLWQQEVWTLYIEYRS